MIKNNYTYQWNVMDPPFTRLALQLKEQHELIIQI